MAPNLSTQTSFRDEKLNTLPQDSIFAGRVLIAMADQVSSKLAFTSWMLLGFGGILGLVIANVQTVSKFVAPEALGYAIKLFLIALIFNVLQRYLASIVAASVALGKEIGALPIHENISMPGLSHEIERATLWPMKKMVRWSSKQVTAGDFAVSGRLSARLAQVQAWFVFVELLAVLASALVIANALHG